MPWYQKLHLIFDCFLLYTSPGMCSRRLTRSPSQPWNKKKRMLHVIIEERETNWRPPDSKLHCGKTNIKRATKIYRSVNTCHLDKHYVGNIDCYDKHTCFLLCFISPNQLKVPRIRFCWHSLRSHLLRIIKFKS